MARKKKQEYTYQVNLKYKDRVNIEKLLATDDAEAELKGLFIASDSYGWPAPRVSVNIKNLDIQE